MSDQKTLVIGSSGFLGRQITSILASQENIITTHYRNPLYPTSIQYDFFGDDIEYLLKEHNIGKVIFAGMVEDNPLDNVQVAMGKFAKACQEKRVIYLSSDGIFDGQNGHYTETDIPSSQTLYGRNLATCESVIADHCRNFCIVRPSYIYGFSNGKLDNRLTKTLETLKAGREVLLFNDMFKSPLGVKQVARAVIDLSHHNYMGIIHVAGQRMSVYEFHREAMRALNFDTRNLGSCEMPPDKGLLRDTSLDISLWQQLTASQPKSIQDVLTAEKDAI